MRTRTRTRRIVATVGLVLGIAFTGACDLGDQIRADVCSELGDTVAACDGATTTIKVFEPQSPDLFCERAGDNPWGVPSDGKEPIDCPGGGWAGLEPGSVKTLH